VASKVSLVNLRNQDKFAPFVRLSRQNASFPQPYYPHGPATALFENSTSLAFFSRSINSRNPPPSL